MGAWGVTARQCDYGLDTLALIEKECLKPIGFRHFDVKCILEHCKNHIINEVIRENAPYTQEGEDIQEYIDDALSRKYDTAIMLVVECLADYFQTGVFRIRDYEANTEMEITTFIFTDNLLDELYNELQKMLDPKHSQYKSWIGDDTLQKWKLHMKFLCDSLIALKGGIVNE